MTNGKFDVRIVVLTTGHVNPMLMNAMLQFVGEYSDKYNIMFGTSQKIIVDNNRNYIVKQFLQTQGDYLIMIDEDTTPNRNPLDLIEFNKDILVCAIPIMQEGNSIAFGVFDKVTEDGLFKNAKYTVGDKLTKVYAGGTGCIIIKRQVLEKVKKPFESRWDSDGIRSLGSDLNFCDKAQKLGFEVWTHWDYICSHYKTLDLLTVMKLVNQNK